MENMENKENKVENTEDEGYDVYTLTDEDGNENEYELIGTVEMDGNKYYALIPADLKEESEYLEYVILKMSIEDGEEMLVTIEDDEEYDRVADYFDDTFADEIDCDGENK